MPLRAREATPAGFIVGEDRSFCRVALETAAVAVAAALGRGASVCTVRRAGAGDAAGAWLWGAACRSADAGSHDHVTAGMCSGGSAGFLLAAVPCSGERGAQRRLSSARRSAAHREGLSCRGICSRPATARPTASDCEPASGV